MLSSLQFGATRAVTEGTGNEDKLEERNALIKGGKFEHTLTMLNSTLAPGKKNVSALSYNEYTCTCTL